MGHLAKDFSDIIELHQRHVLEIQNRARLVNVGAGLQTQRREPVPRCFFVLAHIVLHETIGGGDSSVKEFGVYVGHDFKVHKSPLLIRLVIKPGIEFMTFFVYWEHKDVDDIIDAKGLAPGEVFTEHELRLIHVELAGFEEPEEKFVAVFAGFVVWYGFREGFFEFREEFVWFLRDTHFFGLL